MLLESLQMTGLAEAAPVQVVSLHGSGTYAGYKYCGNFTGPEEAAGEKVVYQGHSVTLHILQNILRCPSRHGSLCFFSEHMRLKFELPFFLFPIRNGPKNGSYTMDP